MCVCVCEIRSHRHETVRSHSSTSPGGTHIWVNVASLLSHGDQSIGDVLLQPHCKKNNLKYIKCTSVHCKPSFPRPHLYSY